MKYLINSIQNILFLVFSIKLTITCFFQLDN